MPPTYAAKLLGFVRGGHMTRRTAAARLRESLAAHLRPPERTNARVALPAARSGPRFEQAVRDKGRALLPLVDDPSAVDLLTPREIQHFRARITALIMAP